MHFKHVATLPCEMHTLEKFANCADITVKSYHVKISHMLSY